MSKSVPNPSQKGVPEKSKNVVQEKPKPSVAEKAKEVGSEKSKTVDSKKTPEVVPDKSKEAVSDKSKELVPDKSKEGDPKKPKEAEADKSKETKSTEVVAEKPPEVILERATSVVLYPDLFPEEPPSLEAELKRGARELKLRQRKTQRERSRKKKKDVDPKVSKIVFPETPKFSGCHHNETIVIERELLRPEEHIKLLAMPKEKPIPQYARLVHVPIPPATNHIKVLAQPRAYYIKDTINRHGKYLQKQQIQRMNERLHARDFLTLQESHQFARQQRRDEKRWNRFRQRQEQTLKNRIIRLELEYLREMMKTIHRKTRSYFLEGEPAKLEGDQALASDVILAKICGLIGVQVPRRDGPNLLDQHYCEMADKMAAWMCRIMQSCGMTFERPEDTARRLSAASSIFEDPRPAREAAAAAETLSIAMAIVDICLVAAITQAEGGSIGTVSTTASRDGNGGRSVSQMVMKAESQETTRTMRDKGSKVNFLPVASESEAKSEGVGGEAKDKK
ncbi:uncharacterized protein LOC120423765 [Culex pipiens pallens]|uniref:uncharacterized protein LOC120423765 n=1 Tax=Culex pipiens pallens TaxID=42434 RepID=UPI00195463D9|nr:uncharacterized protein LOC120423765 [Culex pipiens pallens]